jgi:hypothetical protein
LDPGATKKVNQLGICERMGTSGTVCHDSVVWMSVDLEVFGSSSIGEGVVAFGSDYGGLITRM